MLENRKIILCVSASISAYKSVSILRKLKNLGAFVSVCVTPSTSKFVGSATFSALASEPVYDDLWSNRGSIAHTSLGKSADLILVAPASASTISKIANGYCDEIVSATLLATPKQTPVLIAPAMHEEMYENFATQNNIKTLSENGYNFIGPDTGELAGGDIGKGRLSDEDDIVNRVVELLKDTPLLGSASRPSKARAGRTLPSSGKIPTGKKMIVTAGGTREPIDPVRVITNRSSGKMGHAIAEMANISGYDVTLITTSALSSSENINRINVETADEMFEKVMSLLAKSDVLVMAAAVGDVKPKKYSPTKLKREAGIKNIELVDNVDISSEVLKNKNEKTKLVCFAAETDNVLENAYKKAIKKQADVLVVNDVSRSDSGFNSDTNKIWLGLKPEYKFKEHETLSKEEAAFEIIEAIESIS